MLNEATIGGKRIDALADGTDDTETPFLGRLTWFSIGSVLIDRVDLEYKYAELGLSDEYLPSPSYETGAFKDATKRAADRSTKEGDQVVINMVRSLGPRKRRMVREVQDVAGNRLHYAEIGEWELTGKGSNAEPYKFHSRPLTTNGLTAVFEAKDVEVRELYRLNLEAVREDQLRRAVKLALDAWGAITLRSSGGVFFVPEGHASDLEKFAAVLEWANGYRRTNTRSEVITVPVVDSEAMREMVARKYEEEATTELEALLKETMDLVRSEEVSTRRYKGIVDRLNAAKVVKTKYEDLMGSKMVRTQTAMDLLNQKLVQLIEKVR